MTFNVSIREGVDLVVTITGSLDGSQERLTSLVRLGDTGLDLAIDLSGVSFMDADGVRALERARDACIESGATFAITAAPPRVRRALEDAGEIGPTIVG